MNTKMKVWPNPTSGKISLNIPSLIGNTKIEIYSMYGQIIHSEIFNNQKTTSFNIENNADGIYFISLINDGFTQTIPIVVQH